MTIILRRFSVSYARLTRVPCSGTTFVGSGSGPIDPTQNRPICVQSTQYSRLSERFYVEGVSWDSRQHSGGLQHHFPLNFLFILAIVAGKTKEAGDVAGHWGFLTTLNCLILARSFNSTQSFDCFANKCSTKYSFSQKLNIVAFPVLLTRCFEKFQWYQQHFENKN